MIRLGLLDPPEMVPYSKLKGDEEAGRPADHKDMPGRVAEESMVLLKNAEGLLPLDKSKLKSIAVIGPRANDVLLDWYAARRPTPSRHSTASRPVGPGITVNYAANNTNEPR